MDYILLDRSIFHREKFELLRASPLLQLTKDRILRVYFTPGLIEETLHFGLHHRAELKIQLEFLFELNSTHWFRTAKSIIDAELGLKYVHSLYYLLTDEEIARINSGAKDYIEGNVNGEDFRKTLEEVEKNNQTRAQSRKRRLSLRRTVPPAPYDFPTHFEKHVAWLIEEGLMKFHDHSTGFLERWRLARSYCPFTEQYLRCWLATMFLPVTQRRMKVGENDLSDATQLAYLTWADTMVSDDKHFMKKGFELLFGRSGKKFLTQLEFLEYMNQLINRERTT